MFRVGEAQKSAFSWRHIRIGLKNAGRHRDWNRLAQQSAGLEAGVSVNRTLNCHPEFVLSGPTKIIPDSFLDLTFDGGRFLDHSIPVEVLSELGTVQHLVLRVARHLFLTAHPTRKRVPRGFVDAAQLHLISSEANCFTAHLDRSTEIVEGSEFLASGRDLAIRALGAASTGEGLPGDFPPDALELLAALGSKLDDDEFLLVARSANDSLSARVDQSTRAKLAALIKRPLERAESLDGEVEQMDDLAHRYVLRTRDGKRIEVPFEMAQRDSVVLALQWRPITRVRVSGKLVFANPPRMKNVEDLELIDDERAPEIQVAWTRIESFDDIRDGWFSGEGLAPSAHATSVAKMVLARLLIENPTLPRPQIYPTPLGGVQAEWVLGRWATEVTFSAENEPIAAAATHADTGIETVMQFNSGEVSLDRVSPLSDWLRTFTE